MFLWQKKIKSIPRGKWLMPLGAVGHESTRHEDLLNVIARMPLTGDGRMLSHYLYIVRWRNKKKKML